jgi:type VI secretion system protein ImpL
VKILWTILKVMLVLALVAGLAYVIWWWNHSPHIPAGIQFDYRIGWVVLGGILAIILAVILVRKLVFRRREEGFVRQVIEQEASVSGAPVFERQQLEDLERRWQEAIDAIKHSHLRRRAGSAIYALPWFLMIGETGSGKTLSLRNSRLPSAFPELGHPLGETATKNCDWWFFDEAIVLDTAGRYTVHQDMVRDREEWKKFLALLTKYRSSEPINGLVVTIPADKLTPEHTDEMEHYGRIIHQSIDQVMRVLGHSFPVYILVTKIDQVLGMNAFCSILPWKAFGQALGNINRQESRDASAFLDETFDYVSERLKDLRLLILHNNEKIDPSLLLFPEELPGLKAGLQAFVRWAFQENAYHESPILRGVFFSSSNQTGAVTSGALAAAGVSKEVKTDLPGTNRGFFLQDFFAKVLPADRYLNHPIREFKSWRNSVYAIATIVFLAFLCFFGSYIYLTYWKNKQAIESFGLVKELEEQNVKTPKEKNFYANIEFMDRLRRNIIVLEKNNRWYLYRAGLTHSLVLEQRLKRLYVDWFNRGVLAPIDSTMQTDITGFERRQSLSAEDDRQLRLKIGSYAAHLVRRINLTKRYVANEDLADVVANSPTVPSSILKLVDPYYPAESSPDAFRDLYLYALAWDPDPDSIPERNVELQRRLVLLLRNTNENMNWLLDWADRQGELPKIVIAKFWVDKFDDSEKSGIKVPGVFTVAGKGVVDGFLKEMDESVTDFKDENATESRRKQAFVVWYHDSYFASWHKFADDFYQEEFKHWNQDLDRGNEIIVDSEGRSSVDTGMGISPETKKVSSDRGPAVSTRPERRSKDQWKLLATQMTSFNNPYFNLLDEMAKQFRPLDDSSNPPPSWVKLVLDHQKRRTIVEKPTGPEEKTGFSSIDTLKTKVDKASNLAERMGAAAVPGTDALSDYQKALKDLSPVLESQDRAHQIAASLFKLGGGLGVTDVRPGEVDVSPFIRGHASINQQKAILGNARAEEGVFWNLLYGPLQFLLYFDAHESACYIQSAYNETVLAEVEGIPPEQLQAQLYGVDKDKGKTGIIWKFIYSPAAEPFLGHNRKGFYPKLVYDQKIPFYNSFLNNVSQGYIGSHQLKDVYEVKVEGLPTDVNDEAKTKPQEVMVEMTCADTVQRIENYNYPVAKTFKWSQKTCGPVTFKIVFRKFDLTVVYKGGDERGSNGFPQFLQDFRTGEKIFTPKDFPDYATEFDLLDITQIRVRFNFTSFQDVIDRIEKTPLSPRDKIVYCWQ